jgi:hypothetical protein
MSRWPWVAASVATLAAFAPVSHAFVERWFSTGAYAVVQPALSALSNRVPFAVLDVLLVAAVIGVGASFRAIVKARRARLRTTVAVGSLASQPWCTSPSSCSGG